VNFGDGVVGTAASLRGVGIANTGAAPLTISGVQVEGQAFGLVSNACGATLGPGQTCQAVAGFSPTSAGPFAGSLAVTGNDPDGVARLPLTGLGVTISPAPIIKPPVRGPRINVATTAANALAKALAKLGLARLSRADSVRISFMAPAAGRLTLSVGGPRKLKLASGSFTFMGNEKRVVKVRLSARARRTARRARALQLTVKATFKPREGDPMSGSSTVRLKRAPR
jgi:hypothetical protein